MHVNSCAFLTVAVIVTLYQSARGFEFQRKLHNPAFDKFGTSWITFHLCIADALFYAVCSAAGFWALWTLLNAPSECPPGEWAAVARQTALAAVALLGITAQLPPMIQNLLPLLLKPLLGLK